MPRKPAWIHRIPQAFAELEALDTPVVDRALVERLLGLSPRQALRVLALANPFPTGKALLATRTELTRALERAASDQDAQRETRRRARLAQRLDELRAELAARRVRIPSAPGPDGPNGLPPGVTLRPGRLEIDFAGPEELLARLYAFSQALARDYPRFEELLKEPQTRLHPEHGFSVPD